MIRKTLLLSALLPLAACIAFPGEGSLHAAPAERGAASSRQFDLRDFDAIELSGCDRVMVTPGSSFAVTASGAARDLELLRAETRGETLVLGRDHGGCDAGAVPVDYSVTLPALRAVAVSGAGRMAIDAFSVPRFEAKLGGAAELDLAALNATEAKFRMSGAARAWLPRLRVENLAVDLSGASELDAAGRTQSLAIAASGTSAARLRDVASEVLIAGASGNATIQARASGTASVSASGTSEARIMGGPACAIQESGRARVTCG